MLTEDAAFILTDRAFISIDHKMHDGGIFCDLAKAFNCDSGNFVS
jgi:hypothetical protein